jgi:hypothetical protein
MLVVAACAILSYFYTMSLGSEWPKSEKNMSYSVLAKVFFFLTISSCSHFKDCEQICEEMEMSRYHLNEQSGECECYPSIGL